jgi:hypothetical protein
MMTLIDDKGNKQEFGYSFEGKDLKLAGYLYKKQ